MDPVKPFEDLLFRYLKLTSIEPLLVLKKLFNYFAFDRNDFCHNLNDSISLQDIRTQCQKSNTRGKEEKEGVD